MRRKASPLEEFAKRKTIRGNFIGFSVSVTCCLKYIASSKAKSW
jgi:hypothetical protein